MLKIPETEFETKTFSCSNSPSENARFWRIQIIEREKINPKNFQVSLSKKNSRKFKKKILFKEMKFYEKRKSLKDAKKERRCVFLKTFSREEINFFEWNFHNFFFWKIFPNESSKENLFLFKTLNEMNKTETLQKSLFAIFRSKLDLLKWPSFFLRFHPRQREKLEKKFIIFFLQFLISKILNHIKKICNLNRKIVLPIKNLFLEISPKQILSKNYQKNIFRKKFSNFFFFFQKSNKNW